MSAASMMFADSLENLVSGLGTSKDKAANGTFRTQLLSRMELDALYHGSWIAARVVDSVPEHMTRAWREWLCKTTQADAIEEAERTLRVKGVVRRALRLARLYGGAGILIGLGDERPDLPMDPESLGKGCIKYLTALAPWELVGGEVDRDPTSENYGCPSHYMLNSTLSGTVQVHPSRVVRFTGIELLDRDQASSMGGWGLSVLQRLHDAIRNAVSSGQATASLLQEAKTDVISIPDLTTNVQDPDFRAGMLKRFALANVSKSINNALILDASETWEQKQLTFAGLPDVSRAFLEVCAAAAEMPASEFLGQQSKGLGNGGEAEIRHHYDRLSSRQETDLRPALSHLDDALIRHALGRRPKGINYRFSSLWQLSDQERATVAESKAKASATYAKEGLMDIGVLRQAVRSQLIEDGTYPGLADIPVPATITTLGLEAIQQGAASGAQTAVQEKVT